MFEEWLGTYIECSGFVSPAMAGRWRKSLKQRPLKVGGGVIMVNFRKMLVKNQILIEKIIEIHSLVSAKMMDQSKFKA